MYRFRLNKKVIGESCKGIALAVKRSPTDNIQLQRVVGGFLAGWLFFSSALMAVERRGGGVGWRGGETGRGRAEAEAVAGCRGSGRYLVNDYSLARRRCQAWNTRSCLRCSACCCCRPCYCPRIRVRGLDTVPPASLSLPCIRGMLAVAHGMVLHRVSLQLWLQASSFGHVAARSASQNVTYAKKRAWKHGASAIADSGVVTLQPTLD